MTGKETIREGLKEFMSVGEANACDIWKGYAYNGATENYGWHYTPFGQRLVYLGRSIAEALEEIEQISTYQAEIV